MKPDTKQKPLRPTTNKVREALFDILRSRISNARFLDLYAGTGAVGVYALKEGAAEAIFVESGRTNIKKLKNLIQKFGFSPRADIITKKVLPFIEWADETLQKFDIIFLDPPYHTDEVLSALSAIGKADILKEEGIVIAEHFKKRQLPDRSGILHKLREYRYGDSVLSLYAEVNND